MDITGHLIHFGRQHIDTHGADWRSAMYIRQNIALWTERYGEKVAKAVQLDLRAYFNSKKRAT